LALIPCVSSWAFPYPEVHLRRPFAGHEANLETDSRVVVRLYKKRETAQEWIEEAKQALKMTRLSCHCFRSNEVRLWLRVIAYNLGNLRPGCLLGPVG
jgi:hypothetical protein